MKSRDLSVAQLLRHTLRAYFLQLICQSVRVSGQQDKSTDISLYSKIALGLSGGFFVLSIIVLMVTVCLRNKWYRTAKLMQNGSSATVSYDNELRPIENLVYMQETNLENVRQK